MPDSVWAPRPFLVRESAKALPSRITPPKFTLALSPPMVRVAAAGTRFVPLFSTKP